MKLSRKDYARERQLAARTLVSLGIDLDKQDTYDCRATGKRYSVFRGWVSAVWDDAHFEDVPFGTFKVVG